MVELKDAASGELREVDAGKISLISQDGTGHTTDGSQLTVEGGTVEGPKEINRALG